MRKSDRPWRAVLFAVVLGLMGLPLAPLAQAQPTIEVPILVNILAPDQNPISSYALGRMEEGVKANIKDANRILRDQKCGFQIGDSKITFKVLTPPKGEDWSSFQQGTKKLSEMWDQAIKELETAYGKGKGQKIFLANELKMSNGQPIPGLGADGRPASMFEFGTLHSFRGAASDGQFLLHELGHNANLGHKGAKGTFMAEKIASENSLGKRRDPLITASRTIRSDQCDKLKAYWQARTGAKPKAEPKDTSKPGKKVGFYDGDGNCRLGDGEFLAAMDDWIGAEIDDPLFLSAMDAWIQQTNVCSGSGGDDPKSSTLPSSLTPVCLLGGLSEPCHQLQIRQPETSLGLAFRQAFTIPSGATLDLNVSTTTGGLQFHGGNAGYGGLEGIFQHVGDTLFVRLIANQDVRLDPVRELLRLGIGLTALETASAQITIAGTLTDPLGSAVRSFTWTLEVFAMLQALGTEALSVHDVARTIDADGTLTFTAIGTGIREIGLRVFDLSGQVIAERTATGDALRWTPQSTDGSRFANGVYLYSLMFKGTSDLFVGDLKKVVLLR